MLGKLFLALILLGFVVLLMMKTKRGGGSAQNDGVEREVNPQFKAGETIDAEDGKPAKPLSDSRLAAYIFIGLVAVTSVVMLVWQWQDRNQQAIVAIINTESGNTIEYRSKYSLIEERSFQTLDGRTVTVAENERIEVRDAQ